MKSGGCVEGVCAMLWELRSGVRSGPRACAGVSGNEGVRTDAGWLMGSVS